jgi:hypothetical protein
MFLVANIAIPMVNIYLFICTLFSAIKFYSVPSQLKIVIALAGTPKLIQEFKNIEISFKIVIFLLHNRFKTNLKE